MLQIDSNCYSMQQNQQNFQFSHIYGEWDGTVA
jgi:hypothetical protein